MSSDPVFAGDTATLSVKALTVDPILEMNPEALNFGDHLYDLEAQSVLTVTLNNAGQGPLRVLGFDCRKAKPGLRFWNKHFLLILKQVVKTIAVALRPKVLGSFSQTLIFEAPTREEGRFHSLALTGAVVPGALTFCSVLHSILEMFFRGYEKKHDCSGEQYRFSPCHNREY